MKRSSCDVFLRQPIANVNILYVMLGIVDFTFRLQFKLKWKRNAQKEKLKQICRRVIKLC